MSLSVLVVGSTGSQGGAVARALLDREGFEVHALTRSPEGEEANSLADRGATIVEGDLSNPGAIPGLLEDVDAVFGMTDFWEHGYEDELEQGTNLAEAVAEGSIEHFVFSSVGSADEGTGIPHFESKFEIEERIRELNLPATILRPVFFMQNFEGMRDQIQGGELQQALEPGISLQMLHLEDHGAMVANVLEDPDTYIGEAIEVASDELTLEAMALRFTTTTGRNVEAVHVPMDDFREAMGEEYAVMYEWFNEVGYKADLTALRRDHDLELTPLQTYLEQSGWAKLN